MCTQPQHCFITAQIGQLWHHNAHHLYDKWNKRSQIRVIVLWYRSITILLKRIMIKQWRRFPANSRLSSICRCSNCCDVVDTLHFLSFFNKKFIINGSIWALNNFFGLIYMYYLILLYIFDNIAFYLLSKFHNNVPFPEKSIQELCQGPSSVEKNGHFFCTSTQDHWYSWGGMWNCSDACAWETKRRGQLYSATGHASGALLPPAGWRSSKTLCPCPGIWYFADVPAAHCSSGWGTAREGGEARRADQCPGKEQSQSFLASQFHKEHREADLCFSDSREDARKKKTVVPKGDLCPSSLKISSYVTFTSCLTWKTSLNLI